MFKIAAFLILVPTLALAQQQPSDPIVASIVSRFQIKQVNDSDIAKSVSDLIDAYNKLKEENERLKKEAAQK